MGKFYHNKWTLTRENCTEPWSRVGESEKILLCGWYAGIKEWAEEAVRRHVRCVWVKFWELAQVWQQGGHPYISGSIIYDSLGCSVTMYCSKRCSLHVVGTSARQPPLPRCKSQTTAVLTETAPALTRRLARVNFKECPKTAFGLPVIVSSMSLVSSDLVGGCPGGCRGGSGSPARIRSWWWVVYTHDVL